MTKTAVGIFVGLSLVGLILVGCASARDGSMAWSSFQNYRKSLSGRDVEQVDFSAFLSHSLYREVIDAKNPAIVEQNKQNMAFPIWLDSIVGHHEKTSAADKCLTVSGITRAQERVAIDMRYVSQDNHWRLDKQNFIFLDAGAAYPTAGRCPSETTVTLDARTSRLANRGRRWVGTVDNYIRGDAGRALGSQKSPAAVEQAGLEFQVN